MNPTALRGALDGELFTPDSPGYDTVRRPANPAYGDVRPSAVVRCRSVADVVRTLMYAVANGERVAPRGGGHCFAGRSSTDGIVLDLAGLDHLSVSAGGVATIGAGARLAQVYAGLHARGRTLPAGCGPTVGIAGLTLGGGIGLLGRTYGLTCDRLIGAQVVLADGRVTECDSDHEPELFWGLRGAGGGQFGVVTELRFDTVPEPVTTRIEAHWPGGAIEDLVAAWQAWAPDATDELTVNLTLQSQPGSPAHATLYGAATLDEAPTRAFLSELAARAGSIPTIEVRTGLPFSQLKETFAVLDAREEPGRAPRIRSEFFSRPMSPRMITTLLGLFVEPRARTRRQLTFTAMGGAYNRMASDATAFAHRNERFLLEHIAEPGDPWLDASWALAHAEGSGHVYPNFPDAALDDWSTAYHGDNHPRLTAIKQTYDPQGFFAFPQAVQPPVRSA